MRRRKNIFINLTVGKIYYKKKSDKDIISLLFIYQTIEELHKIFKNNPIKVSQP